MSADTTCATNDNFDTTASHGTDMSADTTCVADDNVDTTASHGAYFDENGLYPSTLRVSNRFLKILVTNS